MKLESACRQRRQSAPLFAVVLFCALQSLAPDAAAQQGLTQLSDNTGTSALLEALGNAKTLPGNYLAVVVSINIPTIKPKSKIGAATLSYGTLTTLASAANSLCTDASGVAIDPAGSFAYFSGGIGNPGNVCGYRIDTVPRSLTPIAGTPIATGTNPGSIAIEPSGRFLYVVGKTSNNISAYEIERATGKLTPVAGFPVATGQLPTVMVIDRGGRYLYVANAIAGTISAYALNQTTGALTQITGSPFAFGGTISALALSTDGHFLYVGATYGVLATFAVDSGSGALTQRGSRNGIYPGTNGIAADPTGRYLYVSDSQNNVVSGFAVAVDGSLTPAGTPQPIGTRSQGVAVVGDLVYVASTGSDLTYGFRVNAASGALAPVAGSPFSVSQPAALAGRAVLPEAFGIDAGEYLVSSYAAFGGKPPYTWSVASGTLPPGLSLNALTGVLSGAAASSGTYTFTAQVADSAGATAARSKTIEVSGAGTPVVANYQGLFYNAPAESEAGWGINFAHQGDIIFATWFTYDATGSVLWLSMTASKTAEGVYGGTLYQTRGPAFSAVPFSPSAVSSAAVGTGTLTFTDGNNGKFAYVYNGISQTKNITRQVFGAVPSCTFGAQTNLALATNYQDLWYAAPAESEAGWGVNFTHQGDNIFVTWFTYDTDGTPLWLSATAAKSGTGVYKGTLYRTRGPAFSAVPFLPAGVMLTSVGNVTLTFTNGNSATFAYVVNGVSQSKAIVRQVFRSPGTVCQ